MALIKCNECGKEISDKAKVCSNCGFENSLIICPECKKEIKDSVNTCPNCGYEIKKENKKKNKLPLIIGVIILIIVAGIIGFIILNHHNNSIKGQFDKILSSNKTEVIFFERKGNTESDQFKELLDNDLKEQGVSYTTIDITNTSYDDIEYIKEKLHLSSSEFNVYIAVIKGSENLIMINYNDFDRTMFFFANKGLLKDSTLILNEYYYKLGKKALDDGLLYTAKYNLEKIDYKDSKELLKDKRFLLMYDWEYDYSDRYNVNSISAHYNDYSDSFSIYKTECSIFGPLDTSYCSDYNTYDAKVIDDKIYIRPFQSDGEYTTYYTITILNENQFQLEGWNFVITR